MPVINIPTQMPDDFYVGIIDGITASASVLRWARVETSSSSSTSALLRFGTTGISTLDGLTHGEVLLTSSVIAIGFQRVLDGDAEVDTDTYIEVLDAARRCDSFTLTGATLDAVLQAGIFGRAVFGRDGKPLTLATT